MSNSRFVFVGDCLLQSGHWDEVPVSSKIQERLSEADAVIGNLEAPVADGEARPKFAPTLSLEERAIERLTGIGITHFNLANNHIMDYGQTGLQETIHQLSANNLAHFGAGSNRQEAFETVEISGIQAPARLIGVSEPEAGAATERSPGTAWIHETDILDRIRSQTDDLGCNILVVHGGLEYIPIPPDQWRSLLRKLSTTDLDLIVGHHPHTPQGWEVWNGVPIFYSLGNFLMHRTNRPSTKWSIMLEVEVSEGKVTDFEPVLVEDIDGCLSEVTSRDDNRWRYLERSSELITNDDLYTSAWQSIACQLWSDHGYEYGNRLKRFGLTNPAAFLNDPLHEIDRITLRQRRADQHEVQLLSLYNYLRNPSHLDAMKTAAQILTGIESDERSPAVNDELADLLKTSKGKYEYSFTERWRIRFATLWDRLS